MYSTVQTGLIKCDFARLRQIYEDILVHVDTAPKRSVEELLCTMHSTDFTLSRNIAMEHYPRLCT